MKQKLIVEGHNDILVISHLLLAKRLRIKGYDNKVRYEKELVSIGEGKQGTLKTLKGALKTDEFDRIGVVIDADSETKNPVLDTWRSIKAILEQNGYQNLPSQPNTLGTIVQQKGKAQVGIWIMPNNLDEGYLEQFFDWLKHTFDTFEV
jgi:hypothetical protein